MADPVPAVPVAIGQALGRIPSGLFIVTVRMGVRTSGFLASWVQQAGFAPPAITVAIRRDRPLVDWIAETGRFTLNQVPSGGKALLRHFAKGFQPDEPAFEGVALRTDSAYGPVLGDAMAVLHVELAGSLDSGDHRIFLGRVVAGELFDPENEPMIHVRKNGFHY